MSNKPSVLQRALRKLNLHRTTTVYVVGYPKTGTTWLQFLLGNYIQSACDLPEMPLFDQSDRLGRCVRHCVGPAIRFTHRPLSWDAQTSADLDYNNTIRPFLKKRVVFLVRHPLDVLVSHWFQERYQVHGGFSGDLNSYIAHPVHGLDKLLHFYNLWHHHQGDVRAFHLLRYEDLRRSTEASVSRLLEFLDIGFDADRLRLAVERSSFDSMRAMESTGNVPTIASSGLKAFATGDVGNPDSYHVRRGKVGGYRDYLEEAQQAALERRVSLAVGDWLGYPDVVAKA